ncbi:hypothetical protein BB559_001736 [Furculomyces boomerangus]|uniref:Rhodanese domain-containing protein n=2 Tax=Harpellales TaxID=61421 RepID=A0A2T9Z0U7_9FUNG|nr:hypothetical protein BB559_001736 [Furculomyces boomerangus]PWA03503.1 hypothetical protein BB558_000305 [Smittium angustum]
MMSDPQHATPISYEQIKSIADNKPETTYIIDVRNPGEFSAGNVPGSVNIPVTEIKEAFELDENDFKNKYGIDKPKQNKDDEKLVFYCHAGMRCKKSVAQIESLGYTKNVYMYLNGWSEYGNK